MRKGHIKAAGLLLVFACATAQAQGVVKNPIGIPYGVINQPNGVAGLDATGHVAQSALQIARMFVDVCEGQSNAAGRGIYVAQFDGMMDPNVWQWDANPPDANYENWLIGTNPLYQYESVETTQIGPCQALARYRADAVRPFGEYIGIVPVAQGSTSMVNGPWSPLAGGTVSPNPGYLYANAISQTNLAQAAVPTSFPGLTSSVDLIEFAQGETDADEGGIFDVVTQAQYATNLDAFIASQRTSINNATNAPFLIYSMDPYFIPTQTDGQVDLAEKDAPRRDFYTAFVTRGDGLVSGAPISPTLYCSPTNACAAAGAAHWSAQGQRLQALMASLAFPYAQANYIAGVVPGAPTNLAAPIVYGTAVHLQWKQPLSRFTSAVIQYQCGGSNPASFSNPSTFPTPNGVYGDLQTPFGDVNVTGLPLATGCAFRVAMDNESGQGAWSNTLTVTTNSSISAPTNPLVVLTSSNPTTVGAAINAEAPYDGETCSTYKVQYTASGAQGNYTTISGITALPYTITNAAFQGTPYQYNLQCVTTAGTGPQSFIYGQFTTIGTQAVPPAPTNVVATAVAGGASENLSWTVGVGYPSYTFTMRACPHGSTTGCITQNTTGYTPSGTIGGLTSGNSYDFTVAANDTAGQSAFSAITTGSTGAFDYLVADVGHTPYATCAPFRQIVSGETGPVLVVENPAGATFNIGFSGNKLDTTTLLLDAAGGNLSVQSCLDPASGRSVTFSQSTLANMPLIVSGGALITLPNGDPAMQFTGSQYLAATSITGLPGAADWEMALVGENPTAITAGGSNSIFSATDSSTALSIILAASGYANSPTIYSAGSYTTPRTVQNLYTAGVPHSLRISYTASNETYQAWVDGTQVLTNGVTTSPFAGTLPEIGNWSAHGTGLAVSGFLFTELEIWTADAITFSATDPVRVSQQNYYGTN